VTAAWRSGPLGVRSFRLLAGGQFASTIGDYCYAVALPWLVLSAHGGAILLGTRPAIFASVAFLVEAAAIVLVPYLGGQAGAAAILGGLTQREFRTFGARGDGSSQAARSNAALGSRK